MRVALLSLPNSYGADMLVAARLGVRIVEGQEFGGPAGWRAPGLAVAREGEAVVVTSGYFTLARKSGLDSVELIERLKGRFNRVVGFDTEDQMQIHFSQAMLEQFDAVLKVNGVYRDLELYNYVVGARTSHGNWTEKTEIRPAVKSVDQLAKLHPSVPCPLVLVPAVRARTRELYEPNRVKRAVTGVVDKAMNRWPKGSPEKTVHFAGSLTHIQRLDALRRIKRSGLSWAGGITSVPKHVGGLCDEKGGPLSEEERAALRTEIEADGLWAPQLGRLAYQRSMSASKAVVSITGHGEYCFRMAEAWMAGRVLVCQDLSHVRSLFPLENGRNAVFCRPDLEDLGEILQDIEANFVRYEPIARQGWTDWNDWCARADETLQEAFAPLRQFA